MCDFVLLEHPNVVDHHRLWEHCSGVRISRPVSAHSNVHDEEERRVEWIRLSIHLGVVYAEEWLVVHVPNNGVLLPLDGEQMECFTEFGAAGQCDAASSVLMHAEV